MNNISIHKVIAGLGFVGFLTFGCAQSARPPEASSKKSASSMAAVNLAPLPPANKLSGDGFGLDENTSGDEAWTAGMSTGESANTGTATTTTAATNANAVVPTTTTAKVPAGALAAAGGGYWGKTTDSTVSSANPGYLQYYDSSGTATEWFGKPTGTGANSNFTMMKYNNAGTLDTSKQFVAQQQNGQWTGGKILGSNGQPYQIAGASSGQSIVSQGFKYGAGGNTLYNWQAANGASAIKNFQTSGWDLNTGLQSGMAFKPLSQVGTSSVLQPMSNTPMIFQGAGTQMLGMQSLFSSLFH